MSTMFYIARQDSSKGQYVEDGGWDFSVTNDNAREILRNAPITERESEELYGTLTLEQAREIAANNRHSRYGEYLSNLIREAEALGLSTIYFA